MRALQQDLLEITVESSLHLPDVATIILHDPRMRWVDDARLDPGKSIQVAVRMQGRDEVIFDGEIVEIESAFESGTQHLILRAFDRLHRLARGRHVRTFQNASDGDIVRKIAQEAGLQAKIGPTNQVYPYVLQANETNLAFLRKRAAALGYLLFVQGKTLQCVPAEADAAPIELTMGQNLSIFRPRMTTLEQISSVTVRGWDPRERREIVGQARKGRGAPQLQPARDGGEYAQKAFGVEAQHLVADRPIRVQAEADQLAQAVADRHASRFVEAEGTCAGDPAIVAGVPVHVRAASDRFSGTYYVTSATHTYNAAQGYSIEFSISGLHPTTLLSLLQPERWEGAIDGLVIGVITDNQDPDGQGRVKVKYPWLSGEHTSDWARVVVPGGGPERGVEFLPEINDEVLVGFELGDVHHPYVLGGLWNGQDTPPKKSSQIISGGKVQQRIIRSRTGHIITLDDGDSGGVTIEDREGNQIKLDSSKKALSIEIKGDATLKAQGNLTLEAQDNIAIKGRQVTIEGSASVDVKGQPINLN